MLKVPHTKKHTVKSLNTIITVWKDRACIFYKGEGSRVLSNFRMVNIELVDFIFKETRITSANHAGEMHERI